MDVARKVLSDYEQADIKDEITQNALIPELLLQYEESDWVFLRRLASHFGTYLIADCRDTCGKVYFGIPTYELRNGADKSGLFIRERLSPLFQSAYAGRDTSAGVFAMEN